MCKNMDTQKSLSKCHSCLTPTIPVSHIAERYKVSRTTIYKVAPPTAMRDTEPQLDASVKKSNRQDAP